MYSEHQLHTQTKYIIISNQRNDFISHIVKNKTVCQFNFILITTIPKTTNNCKYLYSFHLCAVPCHILCIIYNDSNKVYAFEKTRVSVRSKKCFLARFMRNRATATIIRMKLLFYHIWLTVRFKCPFKLGLMSIIIYTLFFFFWFLNICNNRFVIIEQGSSNYGPRAKSGPRTSFDRPPPPMDGK